MRLGAMVKISRDVKFNNEQEKVKHIAECLGEIIGQEITKEIVKGNIPLTSEIDMFDPTIKYTLSVEVRR